MDIEQIKLKNFMSFLEETIDLREARVLLVCGPNGEGKSTILESIPFCFWGEGRGSKFTDFINEDAETLRVEITFTMEGSRYRKLRQHGADGNINELYIDKCGRSLEEADWSLISDDNKRSTDTALTEILGLDFDLSQNSVFFGQEQGASLVTGGSQERKEIICRLLDAPLYKEASKEAHDKATELDAKIIMRLANVREKEALLSQRDAINASIVKNNAEIKRVSEDLEALTNSLELETENLRTIEKKIESQSEDRKKISQINDRAAELRIRLQQLNKDFAKNEESIGKTEEEGIDVVTELTEMINERSDLEARELKIKAEVELLAGEKERLKALKIRAQSLSSRKEELDTVISSFQTKIKDLDSRVKKIRTSGAMCPILGHQCDLLGEDNKNKSIDELLNEQEIIKEDLKVEQGQLLINRNSMHECENQITESNEKLRKELALHARLDEIKKGFEQITLAEEKLPIRKKEFRTKIDELDDRGIELSRRISETEKLIAKTAAEKDIISDSLSEDHSADFEATKRRIKAINDDIAELKSSEKLLISKSGEFKSRISQMSEIESDIAIIREQVDLLKIEQRIYTELAFAFGKNGIQKEIINDVIPMLEAKANELLSRFRNDNEVKIKFDLDPVTSKGNAKKSGGLDIVINREGKKPRLLNMFSGGEKVRIVFSILLSVSKLLTTRAGKKSETLIIDERVAALDSGGIDQFIEIIRHIAPDFKKILIVSHIDHLKLSFNQQLVVSKDPAAGSKATLIT